MDLSVAMVGAGYFSRFHLEGWAGIDNVHVVALCDQDAEKLRSLASEFDIEQVYSDASQMLTAVAPDIFDIVTPPATHLAMVQLAAAQGVPAICQKPLAPSVAEAQSIVDSARNAGTMLVVHENFRFSPWYREARRLIDSGTLGKIHSIAFRLRPGDGQGSDAYLARQPYFQTMARFLVHETAIHFIDTFRYLIGEVVAVNASLRRLNPNIAGEDAGYIIFEFAGGQTGLFDGNRLNEHPAQDLRRTMGEMWLEGSGGVLRLEGSGRLFLKLHGSPEKEHQFDRGPDTFAGGACGHLQQHVVDHIRTGSSLENLAEDYMKNVRIEQAVYDSSDAGRRIVLSPAT